MGLSDAMSLQEQRTFSGKVGEIFHQRKRVRDFENRKTTTRQ
jgi:hypothetical protein